MSESDRKPWCHFSGHSCTDVPILQKGKERPREGMQVRGASSWPGLSPLRIPGPGLRVCLSQLRRLHSRGGGGHSHRHFLVGWPSHPSLPKTEPYFPGNPFIRPNQDSGLPYADFLAGPEWPQAWQGQIGTKEGEEVSESHAASLPPPSHSYQPLPTRPMAREPTTTSGRCLSGAPLSARKFL